MFATWLIKLILIRLTAVVHPSKLIFLLHSPRGDRVRSKVELSSVLEGFLDLTNFDYRTGKLYDGETPPIKIRNRVKVLAFGYRLKSLKCPAVCLHDFFFLVEEDQGAILLRVQLYGERRRG